jgi:hypothetical protein
MNGKRLMQVFKYLTLSAAITLAFSPGVTAGTAEEIIEHEAGFYYTIQRGDTLWDLSDKFFDSPWYWPELWKENEQIPNPHWIYPGERIRLFQKQGRDTFTFNIPEPEIIVQESSVELTQEPPIPEEKTVYYSYPPMDTVGFIRKEAVNPLGFIFKVKDDNVLIHEGNTVYISYADKDARPIMQGGKYTIYRKLKPTTDSKRNRQLGGQYYILGIVEVTRLEADFVIAKVLKSFRALAINDFILPYERRSPKIPITKSVPDLVGKIIVSEEHAQIIGDMSLAFIDKGKVDNIQEGQVYNIFYQEKEKVKMQAKDSVILTPVDFGRLVVLHTEQETATVLITQTDKSAYPDALIHTPPAE